MRVHQPDWAACWALYQPDQAACKDADTGLFILKIRWISWETVWRISAPKS
ncbi:MAG: hypothetical protein R2795_16810 [Saprospiraceae bacterium]